MPGYIFLAAMFMVMMSSSVDADGINTLITAGKSMDSARRELSAETAAFERVKSAVYSGAIRKGLSAQSVASQYGEPVVKNEDFSTKRERWVYKPAGSSFFEGARIYIYFNANGLVDEVKALQ